MVKRSRKRRVSRSLLVIVAKWWQDFAVAGHPQIELADIGFDLLIIDEIQHVKIDPHPVASGGHPSHDRASAPDGSKTRGDHVLQTQTAGR